MTRPVTAERLDLRPHPEGGWYRRTWTSPAVLEGGRPAASAPPDGEICVLVAVSR